MENGSVKAEPNSIKEVAREFHRALNRFSTQEQMEILQNLARNIVEDRRKSIANDDENIKIAQQHIKSREEDIRTLSAFLDEFCTPVPEGHKEILEDHPMPHYNLKGNGERY